MLRKKKELFKIDDMLSPSAWETYVAIADPFFIQTGNQLLVPQRLIATRRVKCQMIHTATIVF